MVALARLRAEIGHLPEQPLIDLDAGALAGRIEFAGLAAEILQDRAGLEDRDRPAAGPARIDDRRHAVVGRDRQKLRLELVAARDVERDDAVRQPALLQHDGDFVAVGRRPVIELDRFRPRSPRGRVALLPKPAAVRQPGFASISPCAPLQCSCSASCACHRRLAIIQRCRQAHGRAIAFKARLASAIRHVAPPANARAAGQSRRTSC